jgi:hypothetical protein
LVTRLVAWLKVDADGEQVGAEQARDGRVRSVQRPEGVGQPSGSGERILVVEDVSQPLCQRPRRFTRTCGSRSR